MWRRPRLVTADTKSPAPQPALSGWWRGAFAPDPATGDGGGTWADNATAERREACLPVAREGSCLASVASRVTARHVSRLDVSGRSANPLAGGRQRRRREEEGRKPGGKNAPGMKKTALFDIVNRKRRERRIGQRLERHRVGGNALGPGRGRASARPQRGSVSASRRDASVLRSSAQ